MHHDSLLEIGSCIQCLIEAHHGILLEQNIFTIWVIAKPLFKKLCIEFGVGLKVLHVNFAIKFFTIFVCCLSGVVFKGLPAYMRSSKIYQFDTCFTVRLYNISFDIWPAPWSSANNAILRACLNIILLDQRTSRHLLAIASYPDSIFMTFLDRVFEYNTFVVYYFYGHMTDLHLVHGNKCLYISIDYDARAFADHKDVV